jgi:Predicted nucleotide-binding protein containing TIR-like domain
MLDNASFAFLVCTAEDELTDGKLQARANVIHEVGLGWASWAMASVGFLRPLTWRSGRRDAPVSARLVAEHNIEPLVVRLPRG